MYIILKPSYIHKKNPGSSGSLGRRFGRRKMRMMIFTQGYEMQSIEGSCREPRGIAGRHWTVPMKKSIDFACWKLNKRNRNIFGAGRYRELPGALGSLGKSPGPLRRPETCSATPGPKWSISITRTIHLDPCRPLAASLAPRSFRVAPGASGSCWSPLDHPYEGIDRFCLLEA